MEDSGGVAWPWAAVPLIRHLEHVPIIITYLKAPH